MAIAKKPYLVKKQDLLARYGRRFSIFGCRSDQWLSVADSVPVLAQWRRSFGAEGASYLVESKNRAVLVPLSNRTGSGGSAGNRYISGASREM